MSEPRKPPVPARPAAPAKPHVPGAAGSPRPPVVAPGPIRGKMPSAPAYTPPKKEADLPSDSGWDTADTVTSMPDVPAPAPTPKGGITAPVATPTPSRSVPPPAASTSPGPSLQGLSAQMREEVWAIVRAAIAEATQPLVAKQRDLEARLERAEQAATNAPKMPSIPVQLGPSLAPPAITVTPDSATRPDYVPPKAARLSVPPGVYGVAVLDPGPQKPEIDLANVGPIHDMPNFGGRSKTVAKVIAALMVLAVVGAIVMTILSHS